MTVRTNPPPGSPPPPPPRMSPQQIEASLQSLPEWNEISGMLQRTYEFASFVASMAFVNQVAATAEVSQHHPDILIRWNKVTLSASTHDAGGITEKDFTLARDCDRLYTQTPATSKAQPPAA